MARSKDVYAVIGLMCIDPEFRDAFFNDWLTTSRKLVGSLSPDEKEQLEDLAGATRTSDKDVYVGRVKGAFGGVKEALNCPNHPCPDPDPYLS